MPIQSEADRLSDDMERALLAGVTGHDAQLRQYPIAFTSGLLKMAFTISSNQNANHYSGLR